MASAPSSGRPLICLIRPPPCLPARLCTLRQKNKKTLYRRIVYLKWKYYLSVSLPVPRGSHASSSRLILSILAVGSKPISQYCLFSLSLSPLIQFCFRTYRQFFFPALTSHPMTQALPLYLMTSEMHVLSLGFTNR